MRLRIGEFARLGQVSVQTLRYYDDLGLLPPHAVDPFSGYRFYQLEQLQQLNRILALKDLGVSLEQIKSLLEEEIPVAELRRILKLRQKELHSQVQDDLDRLERIKARLAMLDEEAAQPSYEVVVKPIDPVTVVSVRAVVPDYWDVSPLWVQLSKIIKENAITPNGPYFTICHTNQPEIDLEVCAPIPGEGVYNNTLPIRKLEGIAHMASTIHQGSFYGLAGAFAALMGWIDRNDYEIAGPDREIYHRLPAEGKMHSDTSAITEMQVPIRKP